MELSTIKFSRGARRKNFRAGRGSASGGGKTACRGENGQKSRSGVAIYGFEGGQMPLYRRLPKRGFKNAYFRREYACINVSDLNFFQADTEIVPEMLFELGMIKRKALPIKVLGDGVIDRAIKVRAHKFSKSAIAKITAAGGSCEVIS